jgi:hypothetical protein
MQSFDADIQSPNDMIIDPDEYVVEQPENEKEDIAIINPDEPVQPPADDCMSYWLYKREDIELTCPSQMLL